MEGLIIVVAIMLVLDWIIRWLTPAEDCREVGHDYWNPSLHMSEKKVRCRRCRVAQPEVVE